MSSDTPENKYAYAAEMLRGGIENAITMLRWGDPVGKVLLYLTDLLEREEEYVLGKPQTGVIYDDADDQAR